MTLPPEGQRIIDHTARGEYWNALGVSRNATLDEIATSHLKLLHRYREFPNVVAALNQSKAAFHVETKAYVSSEVRQALFKSRLTGGFTSILISWPVRWISIFATVLVLWNIHNPFLSLAVFAVLATFAYSLYKEVNQPWYFIVSILLLLWGGSSWTLYRIFVELIHIWVWLSIILATAGGLGLLIVLNLPIFQSIREKVYSPNLWKSIGITCSLFMFTFGVAFLVLPGTNNNVGGSYVNILTALRGSVLLLRVLWLGVTLLLFVVFASIYSGGLFKHSNWSSIWENKPDRGFIIEFLATLLSVYCMLELLFYIQPVRDFISFISKSPISVTDSLNAHFQDFIPFYGSICILTIPVYLIIMGLAKGLFKDTHWSLFVRFIIGILSFYVATYLVNILVPALGLSIPLADQFVIYQAQIFST